MLVNKDPLSTYPYNGSQKATQTNMPVYAQCQGQAGRCTNDSIQVILGCWKT